MFLTEDRHNKHTLKALESVGKEILTGFLDGLVKTNILKLEETEKKKFYDAKPRDKAWVLADVVRQKRDEAGQILLQTFLNPENLSPGTKGKHGVIYKKYPKFSSMCLAPMPLQCPQCSRP